MTSKTFVSGTVIDSAWLNDINGSAYNGTGVYTPLGANALPTTNQAKFRQNVNVTDWPSFALALTDIGATPTRLVISTTVTLVANTTIPANIELDIQDGGSLSHGAFTLTINGPFNAGWYQVFTGAGAVTFGPQSVRAVTPLWWNANAVPGTTDMIGALNASMVSIPKTGGAPKIELPPSDLFISSKWVITDPVIVTGFGSLVSYTGASQTRIIKAAAMTTAALSTTGVSIKLRDFAVIGLAGNTGDGIEILSNGVTLTNVRSNLMGGNGIRIGSNTGVNANDWALYSCITNGNTGHGLYIHDSVPNANAGMSLNLTTQSNGGDGVNVGLAIVNTFIGTLAEFNTGWGCRVAPAIDNQGKHTFVGGDYEANTAGQFNLSVHAFLNYVQIGGYAAGPLVVDEGVINTVVEPGSIKVPEINSQTSNTLGPVYNGTARTTVKRISNDHPSANNRNYALRLLNDQYGDFGLYQSALSGGDAGAVGAVPKLLWDIISGSGLRMTTGVPNNANGINGDFCFRSDGGAGTSIYMKRAGAWVGIV